MEDLVLSCWPHQVATVHKSMKRALQERPPAAVLEREVAAKAAWDARSVTGPDDLAALADINW